MSSAIEIQNKIESQLQNSDPKASVTVTGEDGVHFEAIVVSTVFKGLKPVQRHQAIHKMLHKDFNDNEIHALEINLRTPDEWAEQGKSKVPEANPEVPEANPKVLEETPEVPEEKEEEEEEL